MIGTAGRGRKREAGVACKATPASVRGRGEAGRRVCEGGGG